MDPTVARAAGEVGAASGPTAREREGGALAGTDWDPPAFDALLVAVVVEEDEAALWGAAPATPELLAMEGIGDSPKAGVLAEPAASAADGSASIDG